jgi:hypothetical protein
MWEEQIVPQERKYDIIYPTNKKGHVMMCDNYRAITLLCTAYKTLENILYVKLVPYAEEKNMRTARKLSKEKINCRSNSYYETNNEKHFETKYSCIPSMYLFIFQQCITLCGETRGVHSLM